MKLINETLKHKIIPTLREITNIVTPEPINSGALWSFEDSPLKDSSHNMFFIIEDNPPKQIETEEGIPYSINVVMSRHWQFDFNHHKYEISM